MSALVRLRRKIESAYFDRGLVDYPPFALNPFEDRARYHAFILKLINEEILSEGGKDAEG